MSPAVIKRTHTPAELRAKRERLLHRIGLTKSSQLAKLADKRMLTDEEEAVAYELESIAFLLGEDPIRIN